MRPRRTGRALAVLGRFVAELRVRRGPDTAGVLRRILIEVDGTVSAGLRPDEEQIVTVAAGRHVLRARMDWIASEAVAVGVGADDVVELETALPWRAILDMVTRPKSALVLRCT